MTISKSAISCAIAQLFAIATVIPASEALATPGLNLRIENQTTELTDNQIYYTENIGEGNKGNPSLRVIGSSNVEIAGETAIFTAHNKPDSSGKGDYTAFASKLDVNGSS